MALVSVRYGYVLHLAVSNGPKRDLLSIKGSYRFMVLTQRAQAHTKKIPSFFIFFVGEQSIVCSDWQTDLSMTSISHVIASCHSNPSHYKYRKSGWPQFSRVRRFSSKQKWKISFTTKMSVLFPCIKHNFLHNNSFIFIRWNYACFIYPWGHSRTTWTKFPQFWLIVLLFVNTAKC